jgi:hypothetical protein
LSGRLILAVVLVAIGIISLAYQGITYTTHKKVIDLGPLQATEEEHHTLPLPPILGVISLVGGIVLLATGKRGS